MQKMVVPLMVKTGTAPIYGADYLVIIESQIGAGTESEN